MRREIKIGDEAVSAFLDAMLAHNPAACDGNLSADDVRAGLAGVGPVIVAQALREAYWKLREHASGLRATEVYRKASERREGTLGESPAHQRYRWLEATARGIEDGARDIADLLGVEEHDIESPDAP